MPNKAMLLAAGEGTRLRPLTDQVPKCMVPIGGRPVLEHNIQRLKHFGVDELIINLYYLPRAVQDYFGDGGNWGVKITYSLETTLLGTAGGVKRVESFFDGPFFVWYGDNLSTIDLRRMADFHRQKRGLATIALFHRPDPTSSGIVGLDEQQRITRFLEKPKPEQVFSHWVSAGIFLMEPAVLAYIPAVGASDFGHDVLPNLLADDRPMYGYQMGEDEQLWWIDTPADWQRIQNQFRGGN